ncbi:MAG: peptide chain release factor N(5)-glutamine methyltransferase [Anaerolineae bacterium]|nr:peptide chain release factor N(5)-glutamine methyltransferase [Anaerolineae bacterium]
MTTGAALRAAEAALSAVSDSARLDARLLLEHVLGVGRAALVAHPERALSPEAYARFMALVNRAAQGEPVPYLTGRRAFFRHDFLVTPDVLIPRPETEHLVEAALAWAGAHSLRGAGLTLVDVGTGSGAIAVSLAAALPGAVVYALDVSPAALAVARQNAQAAGVEGAIRFGQGDLLAGLPEDVRPDLVAANLPYIPSVELAGLDVVKYEPRLALDGGPDGLDMIRALLEQAAPRLAKEGCLLLEIGAGQGAAVAGLCAQAFPGALVRVINDYAGHDRVVEVLR